MRGNSHVRFGGRAEETDLLKGQHRASARSNRSAATAMLAQGTSVRDAAEILGHDPRMTLLAYAQATEAGKRQAADGLAAWFQPTTATDDRGVAAGLEPVK